MKKHIIGVFLVSINLMILSSMTDAYAHKITHNNAIAFSCSMSRAEGWKSNAVINGETDQSIIKDQILSRINAMKELKERIKKEYEDALNCLDSEIYELYEMQELKAK